MREEHLPLPDQRSENDFDHVPIRAGTSDSLL
jgi:hypothetical protein